MHGGNLPETHQRVPLANIELLPLDAAGSNPQNSNGSVTIGKAMGQSRRATLRPFPISNSSQILTQYLRSGPELGIFLP